MGDSPVSDATPAVPIANVYEEAAALAEGAAEPAVVGAVRSGTAGWTDPTLMKSNLFYPSSVRTPQARLEHYARHFDLVEVDATYYALLPPRVAERWVAWTRPSFRFDVKAYPVLTGHPLDVSRLPADLKSAAEAGQTRRGRVYPRDLPKEITIELESRFKAFVAPLASAGRLGCVMLQFPPWFEATRGNARAIEAIAERWDGIVLSVEFRHPSWLASSRRERVFNLLRASRAVYVGVDEPDVATGGVPPVVRVTNPDLAIVRFHGQNASGWRRGASVQERFDYLYGPSELSAWVAPIRRLSGEAQAVHAIFNNCVRNYAVLNAKGLAVLLEAPT